MSDPQPIDERLSGLKEDLGRPPPGDDPVERIEAPDAHGDDAPRWRHALGVLHVELARLEAERDEARRDALESERRLQILRDELGAQAARVGALEAGWGEWGRRLAAVEHELRLRRASDGPPSALSGRAARDDGRATEESSGSPAGAGSAWPDVTEPTTARVTTEGPKPDVREPSLFPNVGHRPFWKRLLRVGGTLLFALGGMMLLFGVYQVVGTTAITRGEQGALAREFSHRLVAATRSPAATTPSPAATTPGKRGSLVGRLLVPAIGVDAFVVEGVAPAQLSKGPGRYPRSALPGAPGAIGIAGHRTGWGAPFDRLDELRPGDTIRLRTPSATYVYIVTGSTVVRPYAVWVLQGDPASRAAHRLVLTTCTPRFTARNRLVVWADLVPASTRAV